jgi:hypothetical protein
MWQCFQKTDIHAYQSSINSCYLSGCNFLPLSNPQFHRNKKFFSGFSPFSLLLTAFCFSHLQSLSFLEREGGCGQEQAFCATIRFAPATYSIRRNTAN